MPPQPKEKHLPPEVVLHEGCSKKVERLDHLLLKQLIVQVNHDIKEFLWINLFNQNAFGEGQTYLNGKPLSKTGERYFYASSLARTILDNPPIDRFLTARQQQPLNFCINGDAFFLPSRTAT